MNIQNYKNHTRYYYPHHFIFYPVVILLIILSVRAYTNYKELQLEFVLLAFAFTLIGWLSFMMRQHYALNNQNRIIRLELRLRYYQLTNQRLEILEDKLSMAQLAALRFASDEEFPSLAQSAADNNLSPAIIKKSIKNWLPDNMRA
ncbi:DUF6526 family protein [Pedobacter sp. P351]|uniref:DUF6526 family protein n=1 Tax=Pedobacter superstes TaxID=3133441 RepID=UPI0030B12BF2